MMQQQEVMRQTQDVQSVERTTCCIVGGGPAGVVLAFMLARKGVPVTLLEPHMDFEREFRGDTIRPAVLEILEELGLADRLLRLQHTKMSAFTLQTGVGVTSIDFSHLKTKDPYITVISQAHFLDRNANEESDALAK